MLTLLDAKKILAADDVKKTRVDVPEWDGYIFVRNMSGTTRDEIEQACADGDRANFRARLVAATACDEKGNLIFNEPDQPKLLGQKSGEVLDRIFEAACELNGMFTNSIDEAEKN